MPRRNVIYKCQMVVMKPLEGLDSQMVQPSCCIGIGIGISESSHTTATQRLGAVCAAVACSSANSLCSRSTGGQTACESVHGRAHALRWPRGAGWAVDVPTIDDHCMHSTSAHAMPVLYKPSGGRQHLVGC